LHNVDALALAIVIFVFVVVVVVVTMEACGLGADFGAYFVVEDCVAGGGDFG